MAQKDKTIIVIVIVIALILIVGFVVPGIIGSNGSRDTTIGPPSSGGQSSCISKILLDRTFSGKSGENFNLSINSNFTAITVEIWNNGTHSFNCCFLNPNGTIETKANIQNNVFSASKTIFNKFNKIVYGKWSLYLSSDYSIQGTAIIIGITK